MSSRLHERSYRDERRGEPRREGYRREDHHREEQRGHGPVSHSRYADGPRQRDDRRPVDTRDRTDRNPPQDTRAQEPASRRRFTEGSRSLNPAAPSTRGHLQPASQEEHQPHSSVAASITHQPQEAAMAAVADQATAMPEPYQKRNGYLTDSLRENRHKQHPHEGYVSNRDRQQSNRHHPYSDHRSKHHSNERGQGWRSGEEHMHGHSDRQTGMVADRGNFSGRPYRSHEGGGGLSARGGEFSNGGGPWRQTVRGGFGRGGGKWKHDMFSELTKPTDETKASGNATVSNAQPAQPSSVVNEPATEP